jgi:hypothetical protein
MSTVPLALSPSQPRPARLVAALALSAVVHVVLALLVVFDVAGAGGGFGLGVGPGFGVGAGGGLGLGAVKRRQIFSLTDLPEPVRPDDPLANETIATLLAPARARAIAIPRQAPPRASSPVVHFARPARPLGSGTDLGSRFVAAGAGIGGFGVGGGGGGAGWSLGFGRYVGSLRRTGLDVALVIDSTGSMQNVIEELKRRLDDIATTVQRLVPTARIGLVAFRDRDDRRTATAPRRSEDFVVRWTDLTFSGRKVKTFLAGLVAEGGGDWEEAVRDGLETAMRQLKWRGDAKKVIILVGSSPPHGRDLGAIRTLIADWRGRGGVLSTIDVSKLLHDEHERKLHRWLYGEELAETTPLPEFYEQLRASYDEMAREGGGEMISMAQNARLVQHLLTLTFGPHWERDVARIARGM